MATFKLYASNGITPVYTFPVVFSANYPHSEKKVIEHENLRGKGSIIIEGGETVWDLNLRGVLMAADYNALMSLVNTLETTIILNTPYYVKITKGISTTWDYKCKRIAPIEYQEDNLRTNYLEYKITLRINAW